MRIEFKKAILKTEDYAQTLEVYTKESDIKYYPTSEELFLDGVIEFKDGLFKLSALLQEEVYVFAERGRATASPESLKQYPETLKPRFTELGSGKKYIFFGPEHKIKRVLPGWYHVGEKEALMYFSNLTVSIMDLSSETKDDAKT
jgi:hypothetical protein